MQRLRGQHDRASIFPEHDDAAPDFGGGARSSPGNNTFIGNSDYALENQSAQTVSAENNDWGTTDTAAIEAMTFDTTEDAAMGEIDFDPPLAEAAACAPVLLPEEVADLTLVKSVQPGPYAVGDLITFNLYVENGGPAAATNVVITDELPPEVQFVSASAGCTHTAGTVECTVGTLAASANATRVINVLAAFEGVFVNTASATANEDDPTPATSSSAPVVVGAPANVAGVPTVGEWGLILMGLMLATVGLWFTRRN